VCDEATDILGWMNSGFNTPHTHPRATELAIVVKGRMISEFVQETGARKIRNVSTKHSHSILDIFPSLPYLLVPEA
jgi:hypothetical protein